MWVQGHVRDCRDADSACDELCAVSTMWVSWCCMRMGGWVADVVM